MAEQNVNKTELDQNVVKRLDRMDWARLKDKTGITREQVERFPGIARQLAYGQMTDLLYGSTADISGMFSLRAVPSKDENAKWPVKAYTIEKEKSEKDDIFLYGSPITSNAVKEALFERTSWEGADGKKIYGRANANGGRQVAINRTLEDGTKKKEYYLVSLHEPTNRVVGIPVDAVKALLKDEDDKSRGTRVYNTPLTDEQVDRIIEGKAVKIDGTTKEGQAFSAFVQFDAAKRQVVPCHPTWLKEAQRAGVDLGVGRKTEKPAQEAAPAQAQQEKKGKKGPKLS